MKGVVGRPFAILMQESFSCIVAVLVSAGIELTVFLVAGTVLCFEFSM